MSAFGVYRTSRAAFATSGFDPEQTLSRLGERWFHSFGSKKKKPRLAPLRRAPTIFYSAIVPRIGSSLMAWKCPKIVEVPVGMEINMYACAAPK
jgi:coenzyme PQQ precursor peptide PqqA